MLPKDLFANVLRITGVLAENETPTDDQASATQRAANAMLDSWNAQKLAIYTVNRQVFPMVQGTQAYTLGTGGDFNLARPARIDRAGIIDSTSNPPNPIEIPIALLTDADWAGITLKNLSGRWPTGVWDDGNFPLRTLTFWPVPNFPLSAVLYVWQPLGKFSDLKTDLSFPPAYEDAVTYNLAVRMCANGYGRLTALVAELASESLAQVKRMNMEPVPLDCDTRAINDNRRRFYIYAGY